MLQSALRRSAPSFGFGRSFVRSFASMDEVLRLRNIGISAHIDSGKTTLTERILFYTGRIDAIHDVRGKDGVGAKMDSMDLEREKGITIQSAATFCQWGENRINIIDTPGHVDFTIEVERALRVLDGAVLVLCGVAGVQSQSMTVDRQMRRYKIPRLAFVNKLDRVGANPAKVIRDLRSKLRLNAAAVQLPIGIEDGLKGVVDLVGERSLVFSGSQGEVVEEGEVPKEMEEAVEKARWELFEKLAEVDEEMEELYLLEEIPDSATLKEAIRRTTLKRDFVPVFMGSAFKNKGVQPLLDGVIDYLPNPTEVVNIALDRAAQEAEVRLQPDADAPLVALAFKLEEGPFGQLTYMRVYQGMMKRGNTFFNVDRNQKMKIPRLARVHSDELEDVDDAKAGEIVATFGVECASGDTFTDGTTSLAMTSMYCPEPVISYAIRPSSTKTVDAFSKALGRFQREDPTFRVHVDPESNETIISGMGELHLDIYVERMKREYKCDVVTGEPRVNYRETVTKRGDFNYLHKKQSGGAGQYARVIGYVEPLPPPEPSEDEDTSKSSDQGPRFEFVNAIVGNAIPPEYISACRKGFEEGLERGQLTGHRIEGIRVVLTDGQDHPVDSSEMAFRIAAKNAMWAAIKEGGPKVLEPIMRVEVTVPTEFQGTAIGLVNKRMGQLHDQEASDMTVTIHADVPLSRMFGFSTDLRSATQGKGEFTMEYSDHQFVIPDVQEKLIKDYQKALQEARKN